MFLRADKDTQDTAQQFRICTHNRPPSVPIIKRLRCFKRHCSFEKQRLWAYLFPPHKGPLSQKRTQQQRAILTELQAEAHEGQQCGQGQQQQEAAAEKHSYLFYLLFMVSPPVGNTPCEQNRGNKHVFRGGKPSLSTENNPISPVLQQEA